MTREGLLQRVGCQQDATRGRDQEGVPEAGQGPPPRQEPRQQARPRTSSRPSSEAYDVLSDDNKRKEYDEARRLSPAAAFRGGGGSPGGGGAGRLSDSIMATSAARSGAQPADRRPGRHLRRPVQPRRSRQRAARRGAAATWRPSDPRLRRAVSGVTVPLRLTDRRPARPATALARSRARRPQTCPVCNGTGLTTRNQGSFAILGAVRTATAQGRSSTTRARLPRRTAFSNRSRTHHAGSRRACATASESGWPARARRACAVARRRSVRRGACQPRQGVRPQRRQPDADRAGHLPGVGVRHNGFRADAGRPVGVKVPAGTANGRNLRVKGAACPSAPVGRAICWSPSRSRCRRSWTTMLPRRYGATRRRRRPGVRSASWMGRCVMSGHAGTPPPPGDDRGRAAPSTS